MNPQTVQDSYPAHTGYDKPVDLLDPLAKQHEANEDSDKSPEQKVEVERRLGARALEVVEVQQVKDADAIKQSIEIVNAYQGQDALAANAHDTTASHSA